MLLLVDAGNTRVKWALADTAAGAAGSGILGQWASHGSVAVEQAAQLEEAWRTLDIAGVILSNVAGPPIRIALELIFSRILETGVPVRWIVSLATLAGVRNGYRQPEQLGTDRFAAAIGAHALFPDRALMIVMCGTATTIDAVSGDGMFSGGMILPGLNLMAYSLARNTALLPEVLQQNMRSPLFADNTEDAITGGCIAAQAGAIEHAFSACARRNAAGRLQCIVSGGAAASIAPQLAIPYTYVDNLVQIGLQTIALQSPMPSC